MNRRIGTNSLLTFLIEYLLQPLVLDSACQESIVSDSGKALLLYMPSEAPQEFLWCQGQLFPGASIAFCVGTVFECHFLFVYTHYAGMVYGCLVNVIGKVPHKAHRIFAFGDLYMYMPTPIVIPIHEFIPYSWIG